jgi:ParB-like chromosome segregation protein Spo0J
LIVGANIRPLNKTGLEMLKKSVLEKGWTPTSVLLVSKTHDFDTNRKYRIIDGFHRWQVVKSLSNDTNSDIKNQWQSFTLPCVVLPHMSHKLEVAFAYSFIFKFILQMEMKPIQASLQQIYLIDYS